MILALLALATLAGCEGSSPPADQGHEAVEPAPVALSAGERLRVVATTNIVGDVVHQVGGDRIELITLMGTGVDPHTYVPTPADAAAVHDAHVVLANGAGLEAFLEEMLDSAGGKAAVVHLSDGLQLRTGGGGEGEDERGHGDNDPHVWFDVQNVIRWVATIEHTLSTLDPGGASVYAANSRAYVVKLEELDAWIVKQVATIPAAKRTLVTNHPSFGYLADRYGLKQVGAVYPVNPSSEPSAQDIAALEDIIREQGVPAVFAESTVNPKLAEQVARDTGIQLVSLYTGSLGGPGSGAGSYIDLMRYNINAIVKALR